MLSDNTIKALTGISKATLHDGVRVKHLFRIMTHYPDLWMHAYANIASNKGALTKGVDNNTLDGMCEDRVLNLMKLLKDGLFKPQPVRRVYIPKKNGKRRPLGIPTGDCKLVQEVIRFLLEQIYEPTFSDKSHGFRPNRSCHTALEQIRAKWKGTKWVVDVDISGFYDNINHDKLIAVLEKKIDDKKFIDLIKLFLEAGYLDDWKFHNTYSGTPQGGICSPILANIYLNELDTFVEKMIATFNKGTERKPNAEYSLMQGRLRRSRDVQRKMREQGCLDFACDALDEQISQLDRKIKSLPSGDPCDSEYRKLYFTRYADDFALGLIGSKADAQQVMRDIEEFLNKELKLDIAKDKSGIRHIRKGFDYLGYHISRNVEKQPLRKKCLRKTESGRNVYATSRVPFVQLGFQIPMEKIWEFCKRKGYLKDNRPTDRRELIRLSEVEIASIYNAEMRGFANYYKLAYRHRLQIMQWAGFMSLSRTLANKFKTSSQHVRSRMKIGDDHFVRYEVNGQKKMLKIFKIKHRVESTPACGIDTEQNTLYQTTELTRRMSANKCEYCGKTGGYFEVHHVRKLKDIRAKKHKQLWELKMCARNRKTMILCTQCHDQLHNGTLQGWKRDLYKSESVVQ